MSDKVLKKNELLNLLKRIKRYIKINKNTLKRRVPIKELLILKFPFFFKDHQKPPCLTIELTNLCDLKCVYCNNPLFQTARIHMPQEVQNQIINNIKANNINRIRIGGGEPTLHPNFYNFCKTLSENTKFLSIVTNGQWKNKSIIKNLIQANFSLIEISVDAGGKEVYESSRLGANYELLRENLAYLMKLKKEMKSSTLVKLRLMIRPSNKKNENQELLKWKDYCDVILPQFIVKHPDSNYSEDVFQPYHQLKNSIPKCTLPFKDLQIRVNGDIPYCQVLGSKIEKEEKLIAGNITTQTIDYIWNQELKKFRNEHRNRSYNLTEICRGCKGT